MGAFCGHRSLATGTGTFGCTVGEVAGGGDWSVSLVLSISVEVNLETFDFNGWRTVPVDDLKDGDNESGIIVAGKREIKLNAFACSQWLSSIVKNRLHVMDARNPVCFKILLEGLDLRVRELRLCHWIWKIGYAGYPFPWAFE